MSNRSFVVYSSFDDRLRDGFNLIEIMIALLVIAIISSLAIPGYQRLVARSRQLEASNTLRAIYSGENLYFLTNGIYTDEWDDLDITLPSSDQAKYTYTITLDETATSYVAKATGNLDGDLAIDTWSITEANVLTHDIDDAIE